MKFPQMIKVKCETSQFIQDKKHLAANGFIILLIKNYPISLWIPRVTETGITLPCQKHKQMIKVLLSKKIFKSWQNISLGYKSKSVCP